MSEIELKNCPFCGGEAAFGTIRYSSEMVREQKWTQKWTQDVFHTVSCISCGSSTQKITGHKTQDGAAESWNTRVDPERDRLKAEVERYKMALEHYADEEWLRYFGGTALAKSVLPPEPVVCRAENILKPLT